ncbi:hypothetical protein D7D52_30145 [Nocardia yunnanensis]|uniref:Uncharacterized protein n=1 Tax=Nocardia yunnanensis TaxID=2382165 RepID=A0A386ZIQ9_9NOCA|nr:hypothetical protein D7D52_30145 [Nocardia yunnanensis]
MVRRSAAEFAHLRTVEQRVSWWGPAARVTLTEAERYIDQVRTTLGARAEEIRRRREGVDLRCTWCERERTYIGALGFQTGEPGWLSGEPRKLGQHIVHQHTYRCDTCGSLAFFADGYLEHPLPGRSSPPAK